MNEIEPTLETIQWICKNAEQAWEEGDPKKFQFWEDQKKRILQKCYQRIESLQKQLSLLQQQQDLLIRKIQRGVYSPKEANQINRQIYQHQEEITNQIHYYHSLIQFIHQESDTASPATDPSLSNIETLPLSNSPFTHAIPIEQYMYELFLSILRVIFLSNIGQITICFIVLVTAVYLTWTWNTKNQQPLFEQVPSTTENKILFRVYNRGTWDTKIYINPPNRWAFNPHLYYLHCSAETNSSQTPQVLSLPLNCIYLKNTISSPIPSSSIDLSPGSEIMIEIDTSCLQQTIPNLTAIHITIYKLPFNTPIQTLHYNLS